MNAASILVDTVTLRGSFLEFFDKKTNVFTMGRAKFSTVFESVRDWGGRAREYGVEGSIMMGRKGAWGEREHGAEEHGAEGRQGRKGVWGGSEAGAEARLRLGRKRVWGGRHCQRPHPDTSSSTCTLKLRHFS
jgi:hypothetical protein